MKAKKPTLKQVQAIRCPTCGAGPGEKCELNTGQPRSGPHRDRRLIDHQLWLDQIIPTIPLGHFKIAHGWNPVRPALGQHFDPALIDPVENAKLVRNAAVVGGVQATEPEIFDEAREIVPTPDSLIHSFFPAPDCGQTSPGEAFP
jgi:hypothetical protein